MRRALGLLLVATPALALGQSEGNIGFNNGTTINVAQCLGEQVPGLKLNEDMDLRITWTAKVSTDSSFVSGGRYKVFVSDVEPAAGQDDTTVACNVPKTAATITSQQVGEADGYDATTQTVGETKISMSEITDALGYGPSCNAAHTIYLCVQWYADSSATDAKGFAVGTVSLNVTKPGTPTIDSVAAGDGRLRVSCTGAGSASSFKARATLQTDATVQKFSSTSSSCDLTISGLANGSTYAVEVFALSSANNPSDPSAAVPGTPIPTHDYWGHYDGQEQGGCSTGGGAAGLAGALALLAGLSLLVALRRRNS
jgi:hypothetical protein